MNDDRLESLLRGYALPEVSHALDQRVLARAERTLAVARARATASHLTREFAGAIGFGYVSYVIDLVTTTDAEYHVDLI